MQLWNYPDERELGFELFPSHAKSTVDVTSNIPNVPHLHFVLRLPPGADEASVIQAYGKLHEKVRQAHAKYGTGPAFNVIMVKEWICLIPRRHCGLEKGAGANAAAIVGLVWLTNAEKRHKWSAEYLKYLALPAEDC